MPSSSRYIAAAVNMFIAWKRDHSSSVYHVCIVSEGENASVGTLDGSGVWGHRVAAFLPSTSS